MTSKFAKKSTSSDLNETWYDVRGRWDIHDDMTQGHPRSGSRSGDDLSALSGLFLTKYAIINYLITPFHYDKWTYSFTASTGWAKNEVIMFEGSHLLSSSNSLNQFLWFFAHSNVVLFWTHLLISYFIKFIIQSGATWQKFNNIVGFWGDHQILPVSDRLARFDLVV